MKKGLIFIGAAETGKSRTASEIRKYYGDSAAYLDGRNFNPTNKFCFDGLNEKTKILIIDDFNFKKYADHLYRSVTGNILVNQRYKLPFEIQLDKLIVIASSEVKKEKLPQAPSFQRRFTIIEFPNVEPQFLIDEITNNSNENTGMSFLMAEEIRERKAVFLDGLSFLHTVSETDR